MTPRVSVVVPTFNSAPFVEETISSILAQTYTDFELLVSDHSSTDSTWERLQQFAADPRVRLAQLPPGGGAPANWIAVTEQAEGELLKLVCGDDLIYPTCLAEQVAAFDAHPEAVLVASERDIIDEQGTPIVRGRGVQRLHGLVPGGTAIRRTVRAGTNVFGEPVCSMMRRDVLVQAGGWDARAPYLIDQATCARVLLHGPLVALHRPLAGFRISDQQWSVELAKTQAAHAREFHHLMQRDNPGLLSDMDVRIGDAKATAMAVVRRGAYAWLAWRKRHGRPGAAAVKA